MPPLVSVIVPSYNHADYLRECIESVIWQSFQDWELIVVDDWSSDQSYEVALRFTDQRIRVFRNETNLGTYATLNVALAEASGQYVGILNSDDLWLPTKLQNQVSLLEANPKAQFCYTAGKLADEEGNELGSSKDFHGDYPTDEVQNLLPYLLFENRVLASSVLFRNEQLKFNADLRYSGDWVALITRTEQGPACFVNEPLSVWRQHPQNTYTRLLKVLPEEILVREAILSKRDRWHAAADPVSVNRKLAQCAMALSTLYIRTGRVKSAQSRFQIARGLDKSVRWKSKVLGWLPASFARKRLFKEWRALNVDLDERDPSSVFPA